MAQYPNIFAQGMGAFDDAYERTGKVYSDIARRNAGAALAGGDRAGAAEALGGDGDVDAVRSLQGDQEIVDQREFQNQRLADADEQDTRDRNAKILKEVAQGLKTVPAGQRKAALTSVYPLFQQSGIDTSNFDPLTEEQLTDQQLDVFTGEVDKHVGVNLGGGGYGDYNATKHTFTTLREPTDKAPPGFEYAEDGSLNPIPGYIKGRAALAGATRAPKKPSAAPSGPAHALGPITWHGSGR